MVTQRAKKVTKNAVSEAERDLRELRKALKAVRELSPEALRLVKVKVRQMSAAGLRAPGVGGRGPRPKPSQSAGPRETPEVHAEHP